MRPAATMSGMVSKIVWSICSAGREMDSIPRICRAEIVTTIMISA